MKQLTQAGKNYRKNAKVVAAVESFIRDLNNFADLSECTSHFRWATRVQFDANQWGALPLIDFADGSDYGVTVWSHKGDTFVVPGFADEGWMGRSVNGTFFTVNADEQPVPEED